MSHCPAEAWHTGAMKQLHEQEVLDCADTKISLQNDDSDMTGVLTTSPQLDRKFLVETIQV